MTATPLLSALDPVAAGMLSLCLVAASGLALGRLRFGGVSLGVGGVLFAGIFWGHFGLRLDPEIGRFLREFGLILFVYTIGIQVGPGFVAALRLSGMTLNLLAVLLVALSVAITAALAAGMGLPVQVAVGLMAGAVTNTPALGAATQMLDAMGADAAAQAAPALAYALAYPFGIVGILLSMVALRRLFRVDVEAERLRFDAERRAGLDHFETANVELANPALDGLRIDDLPGLHALGAVVSRVMRAGVVSLAAPETVVRLGDVLLLVGPPKELRDMTRILGHPAQADLKAMPSSVRWERMAVTRAGALGAPLSALEPLRRHDAVISRVTRAGVELSPSPALRLQFGDICTVIGEDAALREMSEALGNRRRKLQEAQVLPIFIGVALGVLLGAIPLALPGMPAPLRLGLAGGPLVAAIALARLGHFGPLVWVLPPSANQALRDLGISMFLGVVGLGAGAGFVAQLVEGQGLRWMAFGAAITIVPLLITGALAHAVWRLNHLTVCGLLAGGMTDPPALAFANGLAESEAASLAYATVYPLVMVLRILAPQLLLLALWSG